MKNIKESPVRRRHPLVRPLKGVEAWWLAGNGRWAKDDGRPHEVFIAQVPSTKFVDGRGKPILFATVFIANNCKCIWGDCPAQRGSDEACDRWGSAVIQRRKPAR